MPKIRGKALRLPVDAIDANPWNPNRMDDFMRDKLRQMIAAQGFTKPVIVRECGERYEIIDGEHRWNIAKELGFSKVPVVNLGAVDDVEARLMTIQLNETHGESQTEDLVRVVSDIERAGGDLALLPFDRDDIASMLSAMGDDVDCDEWDVDVDGYYDDDDDDFRNPATDDESATYKVVVTCVSEEQLRQLVDELRDRGLEARPMIG